MFFVRAPLIQTMNSIKYRPEVDGLRAVAVIPVILFHFGVSWCTGGFAGVDVFFVISGYLITSIILKELSGGVFSFRNFWMRRVRRIMPALIVVLIATAVAGYLLLWGPSLAGLGRQLISVIFLYANVEMWQIANNYWGVAAENAPLLHTWSLSVEEQFYLIYPLVVFLLFRFARKMILPVLLVGALLSFCLCLYATYTHPAAAFYFLPMRAWELAAGGILSILGTSESVRIGRRGARWLVFAGLVLIIAGYILMEAASFPGYQALLPVAGSMLIIQFGGGASCPASKLLSSRPLVYIGKMSYSLYLWHWPVIVFGKACSLKYDIDLNVVVIVSIILLLSVLSYHFVENPARRSKRIVTYASCGVVACLVSGALLIRSDYSCDVDGFEATVWKGELYNVLPEVTQLPEERTLGIEWIARPENQLDTYRGDGVLKKHGGDVPGVVVLGSSHGLMWGGVIDEICAELQVTVSFFTADASDPLIELPVVERHSPCFSPKEKFEFDTHRLEKLKSWKPQLVIIIDRWGERDLSRYGEFIRFIGNVGARVLFIEQPPELAIGDISTPAFLAYRLKSAGYERDGTEYVRIHNAEEVDAGKNRLRTLCAEFDFCDTIRVADLFESDDRVLVMRDNRILYIDDDHLSQAGALLVKDRIKNKISSALNGM